LLDAVFARGSYSQKRWLHDRAEIRHAAFPLAVVEVPVAVIERITEWEDEGGGIVFGEHCLQERLQSVWMVKKGEEAKPMTVGGTAQEDL
jgi:hypothetical protein